MMPLLKILYNAQDKNSHHIYMALIILLILSEDDAFNKCVHELVCIVACVYSMHEELRISLYFKCSMVNYHKWIAHSICWDILFLNGQWVVHELLDNGNLEVCIFTVMPCKWNFYRHQLFVLLPETAQCCLSHGQNPVVCLPASFGSYRYGLPMYKHDKGILHVSFIMKYTVWYTLFQSLFFICFCICMCRGHMLACVTTMRPQQ